MSSFNESAIENIRKLRKLMKYNQTGISSHLNVDQSTVSKWERGVSKIDLDTLESYSSFFHVSPNQLVGYEQIIEDSLSESVDMMIMDSLRKIHDIEFKAQVLTIIENHSDDI